MPDFLARVLTRKVPLERPKDIAELLASYAREARERAAEHPIVAFEGVKSALQESLGITFEGEKGEHFFVPAWLMDYETKPSRQLRTRVGVSSSISFQGMRLNPRSELWAAPPLLDCTIRLA